MNPTPLSLTQTSTLNNLVDSVRIRPASIDLPKAERFIEQASLALVELPTIRTHQLRYDGGYNAAHDVGEALMAAYGFRTVNGPGQHMSIGEVLLIFFEGTAAQNAAEDFDDLRKARNQSRYVANPIGKAKADAAVLCAAVLLAQARILLN